MAAATMYGSVCAAHYSSFTLFTGGQSDSLQRSGIVRISFLSYYFIGELLPVQTSVQIVHNLFIEMRVFNNHQLEYGGAAMRTRFAFVRLDTKFLAGVNYSGT